ncbi:DUF4362 domain-containing protein [Metabacillus fastidiosus]|uniref:DUF4362 domain-containing protein n=1 Tax=Metabacillus fastidiosus TaxID=1458 RepID=UPI002DB82DF8|nr:DUF4362 domain-containing protein [Metabacillus fastidiosus]MEC2076298.1 DUF4362 domain-containing protein [Metabacillus fastidiosus]
MKSYLFIVILLFVAISISGCSKSGAYGSEEAIKRGDVVYRNEVVNLEKFEQFLINLSNKKEDTIRVTAYTHEGDPIFQDLRFDGEVIHYTYDNSNDQFAGNDKGKVSDVCKEVIEKENTQGEIEYLISGCSKNLEHILISIEKKH